MPHLPYSFCAVMFTCLALFVSAWAASALAPALAQDNETPWGITQADVAKALATANNSDCKDARETATWMLQTIREGHYNIAVMNMPALTGYLKLCEDKMKNCGHGPARIGMTKDEAIHTSWCAPDKINTTTIAGHTKEQWVYQSRDRPRFNRGFLYFDNGRLTAIQETP